MRRNVLVLVLGLGFLLLLTWLGTILTNVVPRKATPQVQTVTSGPYLVTLQVDPNPPLITRPTTLTMRVQARSSQASVTDVHILLASTMETMDMGIDRVEARPQTDGSYLASAQFSMSGPWRVDATISRPGNPSTHATFEVTVQ